MQKTAIRYIILFVCLSGHLSPFPAHSFADPSHTIAVVVSKRIKPYIKVLEGITTRVDEDAVTIQTFFLPGSEPEDIQAVQNRILETDYDLYLAVGPEATHLVWTLDTDQPIKKMYTAVLSPGEIIDKDSAACGISLGIPIDIQVKEISRAFPGLKKIGLIFDPGFNSWFYDQAVVSAGNIGLDIIPLQVSSKTQIPKVIKGNWSKIDCVWMIPDQTVISEKIIQYIVKQALYNKKGVIGYNPFFIRSGAVFSFEFDYTEIGGQTGDKIKLYLEQGLCVDEFPLFHKVINAKMADKIGIQFKEE